MAELVTRHRAGTVGSRQLTTGTLTAAALTLAAVRGAALNPEALS